MLTRFNQEIGKTKNQKPKTKKMHENKNLQNNNNYLATYILKHSLLIIMAFKKNKKKINFKFSEKNLFIFFFIN